MERALYDYLLRRGDDSLILSQRLSEWCGHAPTIEVDLSLANLGLDLLGQATLFLDYAASMNADVHNADALAFHRDAAEFRNCLLVEQPNGWPFPKTRLLLPSRPRRSRRSAITLTYRRTG